MEILLGILGSGIMELIKLMSRKFGEETSKKVVLGTVFLISFALTFLMKNGFLTSEHIKSILEVFATAVAAYEVILKPIKGKLGI